MKGGGGKEGGRGGGGVDTQESGREAIHYAAYDTVLPYCVSSSHDSVF